jgi:hypothetical protein
MSCEQVSESPAVRLCHRILYCGGMAGEKVTVPVKPAAFHFCCALTVETSTRSMTVHIGLGVGAGVGVGAGGAGVRVGGWVADGGEVGVGCGSGGTPVASGSDGELRGPVEGAGDGSGTKATALDSGLSVDSTVAEFGANLVSEARTVTVATTVSALAPKRTTLLERIPWM